MTSRILTVLVAAAFSSTALAAAPAATVLSVAPVGAKANTEVLAPEDSDGQVVAARLTAGASAFSVRSVSYELVGLDGECDAGMAHSVRVWKSRSYKPASSPAAIETINIPATMDIEKRVVSVNLSKAIRLEIGDSLFVAVEVKQEDGLGMCVAAVTGAPKDSHRQFVSPELAAPYVWSTFESFGAEVTMLIQASGYPVR